MKLPLTIIFFQLYNDLQAMSCAHRIGHPRAVCVYRLLTSKTNEMQMFHRASLNLRPERSVLAHQRQHTEYDGSIDRTSEKKYKSKREREIQAKQIDEVLKKGAYDMFWYDNETEAQQFMETDIDQLLEQSSRTVTYGSSGQLTMSSVMGSFSKASSVASTEYVNSQDVDLDDPDFW